MQGDGSALHIVQQTVHIVQEAVQVVQGAPVQVVQEIFKGCLCVDQRGSASASRARKPQCKR